MLFEIGQLSAVVPSSILIYSKSVYLIEFNVYQFISLYVYFA